MESETDYIWSNEYDGRWRKLYKIQCQVCNKPVFVPKHRVTKNKYCSPFCANQRQRNRLKAYCAFCNTEFERPVTHLNNSKSGLNFCSRNCKDKAQRIGGLEQIQPPHYNKGNSVASYRTRTLREKPNMCSLCGYADDIRMLDVDHIDGKRSNNNLANLQILCVWCHALKTRGVKPHKCPGHLNN